MGMRGIGATPKRTAKKRPVISRDVHPWEKPGLSRAERVIKFVETLPVTAGPLAGTTLKLRPWQKKFIRAVYKTDKAGNRLVRTAVLSVGRKNGKTQLAAALCSVCAVRPRTRAARRVLQRGLHTISGRPRLFRDGRHHHAGAVAQRAHQHCTISQRARRHGERIDVRGVVGRRCARARPFAVVRLLRRARAGSEPRAVRCAWHRIRRPRAAVDGCHFDASRDRYGAHVGAHRLRPAHRTRRDCRFGISSHALHGTDRL